MSDERLARQWCDLLGWTWGTSDPPKYPGAAVWPCDDGSLRFGMRVPGRSGVWILDIDLQTLATCALVRHAGPVDVGPCPACAGEKRQWSVGSDLGPDGEGWQETDDCDADGLPWWTRPCPACVVDGKPTGHRIVSAPEAVLLASPRPCESCDGHGWAGRTRSSPGAVECFVCGGEGVLPGHEGAREALRALAEGWREHLPVLADWLEASGELTVMRQWVHRTWVDEHAPDDQSVAAWLETEGGMWKYTASCGVVPRSLAVCPAVAWWLLAWLAELDHAHRWSGPTPRLGPHLPAIYAHLTAAWERETVGCRGCSSGHNAKSATRTQRCQRCAGLGRVRLEGVPETHAAAQ